MEFGTDPIQFVNVCLFSYINSFKGLTCHSFSPVVDCGQPPQSENTNIQSSTTTLGSTAIYSCIAGYELSTGTLTLTRECLSSGSWSGMTPNCTSK